MHTTLSTLVLPITAGKGRYAKSSLSMTHQFPYLTAHHDGDRGFLLFRGRPERQSMYFKGLKRSLGGPAEWEDAEVELML